MKKLISLLLLASLITNCNSSKEETITFYKVPLVCGADKEIACGSRVKPLFIETGKQAEIKESWVNRQGTVIAFVWKENISADEKENILRSLFEKKDIKAEYISDRETQKQLTESFFSKIAPSQKSDKWYKGMDVDQLSLEEAGAMGDSATIFALKAGLINEAEASKIKNGIEEYMKTELVKVRTYKELKSDQTDLTWKQHGYEIYVKYLGIERAEKVRDLYIDHQRKLAKEKSCCDKKNMDASTSLSMTSEITCPYCGHKKTEIMPVDVCRLVYTCENCKKDIRAKADDCCVFCSYGSVKCPSKQG